MAPPLTRRLLCFDTYIQEHTFQGSTSHSSFFLLHERKFEACHEELFAICCRLVPPLSKCTKPIVTDEEQAFANTLKRHVSLTHLWCWDPIFRAAMVPQLMLCTSRIWGIWKRNTGWSLIKWQAGGAPLSMSTTATTYILTFMQLHGGQLSHMVYMTPTVGC